MPYMKFCKISVVVGDGIVRLHPILDDLGCILTHIKWMKPFQCTDTIYLLKINSNICYLQLNFNGTPLVMFLDPIHLQKGSKMQSEWLAHGIALAQTNIKCIWYSESLQNNYLMLLQLYFRWYSEVDEILHTK